MGNSSPRYSTKKDVRGSRPLRTKIADKASPQYAPGPRLYLLIFRSTQAWDFYPRSGFDPRFDPDLTRKSGYPEGPNPDPDNKMLDPSKPDPDPDILIFKSGYPDP
ncbi:hypothetical protein DY000_02034081 [Brassica cretica]|uniref:Uncharacterized protein n=1 Tax=Brassica cretica TaxID=69181 RepID=A0ABQ7DEY5_BRACR|nr:hypothetical protein DY000_02034081 [Brassica cretica]